MMTFVLPEDFGLWDGIGLGCFVLSWAVYVTATYRSTWHDRSLTGAVGMMRERWMETMLQREQRMVDVQIMASLLSNVTFFASTSILILAGLFAALGAADRAVELVSELPYAVQTSRGLWELKIAVLVGVFIYAFFKFGWAIRLHSYCSVMVGAAPMPDKVDEAARIAAHSAAHLSTTASAHFNDGVRAYYFGLAALAWFVNPIYLIPSSLWVVAVLWRREFHSHSLRMIRTALHAGRQKTDDKA